VLPNRLLSDLKTGTGFPPGDAWRRAGAHGTTRNQLRLVGRNRPAFSFNLHFQKRHWNKWNIVCHYSFFFSLTNDQSLKGIILRKVVIKTILNIWLYIHQSVQHDLHGLMGDPSSLWKLHCCSFEFLPPSRSLLLMGKKKFTVDMVG